MKLVYLSPVPWLSISQRPHFFVREALKQGIEEVLWINPYPGRLPSFQDLIPGRHAPEPHGMVELAGLTVINVTGMIPVEPLGYIFDLVNKSKISALIQTVVKFVNGQDAMLVIAKPSRLAAKLLDIYSWHKTWYDAMDNYPSFYTSLSKRSMSKLENTIAHRVDKITCSSHPLFDKFSSYTNVSVIRNATAEYISVIGNHARNVNSYVYVGTIASWFDWEWLIKLANDNKDKQIDLYGPIKTILPKLPENVCIRPAVAHGDVGGILSRYATGLIPFKNNEITRYVDPVKFYEYAVSGMNIISTDFGEMNWHYESYLNKMKPCYKDENGTIFFSALEPEAENCWSVRFDSIFSDNGR
ncbi:MULTISPECIES: glycosyl transferase [Aeromonas]|uniref:Glycosyl transferase n=1 Tax=Aeromonas media TaxID=651 RepID=A0A6M4YBC4_AERME|nr:glycosyl transferase [Aeromonas media]MBS4641287.1 glycosyl transferase [Aeromonas media]QJT22538.1 glycosyl transferase [Aeromonas media]QYK82936.1 glycosyl transferase [Aeromonas media]